ncbi:MAG: PASTA domain-containing protein [FCB group bacterium]
MVEWKKYLPYVIITLSIIVGFVIFFFLFDSIIMPLLIHNSDTVTVPDIVGKTLSEADNQLAKYDLKMTQSGAQFSDKAPPNCVINQTPKSGTVVKVGRSVFVIISKGQETSVAPYLIGKSLREARVLMLRKGLQLGDIMYIFSDSTGADTILKQNISPGRDISTGSTINVIVSKGSGNLVKVPNLIGLSYNEVQPILQESGLFLGAITYNKSETYMPNTILSQLPKAGELVLQKTPISIVVSR